MQILNQVGCGRLGVSAAFNVVVNLGAKLREQVGIEIRDLQQRLGITSNLCDARSGCESAS